MGDIIQYRVRGYEGLDTFYTVRSDVPAVLKALRDAIGILPRVDSDGQSECPFAAQLFTQKDNAAEKVEKLHAYMSNYLQTVDEEIQRCHHNLRAWREEVRERWQDRRERERQISESCYLEDLNSATKVREVVAKAIAEMEQALAISARHTYPG